jgi:hypothetical protein
VPADFEALLETGAWPDVDFRSTVLIEGAPRDAPPQRPPGTATITTYANTHVAIDADSRDGGYVVLNDVWHPWWRAEIDGQHAPIIRANVLFRAVAVPRGRHRITFTFRPIDGALDALFHP